MHHASCTLYIHHFCKIFFDIDVTSQIFPDVQSFLFGFVLQTAPQIPISTSNKGVIPFLEIVKLCDPSVEFLENLLNHESFVDHVLGDSSQFCAKFGEIRVDCRFYVVVKHVNMLSS